MIFIRRSNGWLVITDSEGHRMQYLYYSKREALRRFKKEFGWKGKRGVEVMDYTKVQEPNIIDLIKQII